MQITYLKDKDFILKISFFIYQLIKHDAMMDTYKDELVWHLYPYRHIARYDVVTFSSRNMKKELICM